MYAQLFNVTRLVLVAAALLCAGCDAIYITHNAPANRQQMQHHGCPRGKTIHQKIQTTPQNENNYAPAGQTQTCPNAAVQHPEDVVCVADAYAVAQRAAAEAYAKAVRAEAEAYAKRGQVGPVAITRMPRKMDSPYRPAPMGSAK